MENVPLKSMILFMKIVSNFQMILPLKDSKLKYSKKRLFLFTRIKISVLYLFIVSTQFFSVFPHGSSFKIKKYFNFEIQF